MECVRGYIRENGVAIALVVLTVGSGLFGSDVAMIAPFFVLGSGGSCGGGGGGGDCGGGGSECGSCDCESGTCADCCASGCGSTPFLCVWDGERYVFENDVLVAPRTLRQTAALGRAEYEAGLIGSDRYRIMQPMVEQSDGTLRLALREVEPEESYLDGLTLSRMLYSAHTELVTRPDHDGFHAFARAELEAGTGVRDVRATLGTGAYVETRVREQTSEHMLEVGERIELSGTVEGRPAAGLFVLLQSRYRDWTAGVIEEFEDAKKESVRSPFSLFTNPRTALKAGTFFALSSLLWLSGPAERGPDTSAHDADVLASHFGTPIARADHSCHSLVVEFYDWDAGVYRETAVFQPRHRTGVLEAARLPDVAVSEEGEVRVRITATKRHAVSLATLLAPTRTYEDEVREEPLALRSVHHSRTGEEYRNVLAAPRSGEYLHLVPGDIAELTFDAPQMAVPKGSSVSYVLDASGFYTPLSEEGRVLAGDWVPHLDPEAREWLREMYALKEYHAPNRRPILT